MAPTKEERKIYMTGPLRQRKNNLTDMTSGSPIRLILAFAIPLFIGNVFQQMYSIILRAFGNSRTSLYFLIISSVLNIGLDILLVALLDMGVGGAALATVMAQTVSACLSGLYVFKNYKSFMPSTLRMKVSRQTLTALFTQGLAMGLMLCVVDLGSVIFQRANNTLGPRVVSAYTAARRIIVIMMQPLGTMSTAASTFVGQNWGAKKVGRIRETLKKVIGLELLWGIIACCIAWIFGGALVRITTGTTDEETVYNAALSLRIHLTFFPALAVLLCLRTTMQAMGRKTAPVISSCIELAMKILSAWLLIPRLGFLGTCVTEPVTWVLMMIFLIAAFWAQNRQTIHLPECPSC